uniref:Zinc-finger domain-containing protein n=1 Tax=Spongospora subterranea TaxID=70186 RepID=A0A0H5RPU4_9EUKA|eukprot:CRZ10749.1 hypothetical protein [Spongospora subterranea]
MHVRNRSAKSDKKIQASAIPSSSIEFDIRTPVVGAFRCSHESSTSSSSFTLSSSILDVSPSCPPKMTLSGGSQAPNSPSDNDRPAPWCFSPSMFLKSPAPSRMDLCSDNMMQLKMDPPVIDLQAATICDGNERSLLKRFRSQTGEQMAAALPKDVDSKRSNENASANESLKLPEAGTVQCVCADVDLANDAPPNFGGSDGNASRLFQDLSPSPACRYGSMVLSSSQHHENDALFGLSASQPGSSCHQCKSRRLLTELSFCGNVNKKRTHADRSSSLSPGGDFTEKSYCCRKKYCEICLKKFYGENRAIPDSMWPCPSCRSICSCAACRRQKFKNRNIPEHLLTSTSPSISFACGIVYFGNELGGMLASDSLNLASSSNSENCPTTVLPPNCQPVVTSECTAIVKGEPQPIYKEASEAKRQAPKRKAGARVKKPKLEQMSHDLANQVLNPESSIEREEDTECEVTAEAAILLASLRSVIPNPVSAS